MSCSRYTSSLNSAYMEIQLIPSREVFKYALRSQSAEGVDRAALTVINFLRAHPNLIPTFSTEQNHLSAVISSNHYLIINKQAVCLASNKTAPRGSDASMQERGLSENLLNKPVTCSKNHHIEQHRLEFWLQRRPNTCPVGSHAETWSFPLEVDTELKESIETFVDTLSSDLDIENDLKNLRTEISELKRRNEQLQATQREERQYLAIFEAKHNQLAHSVKKADPKAVTAGFVKITIKVGCYIAIHNIEKAVLKTQSELVVKYFSKILAQQGEKILTQEVIKVAGQEAGKKASEKILKKTAEKTSASYWSKVPALSVVIGCGMASYRLYHAKKWDAKVYCQAGAEFASGVVANCPGWGTAASISIDVALIASDIYWADEDSMPDSIELDIKGCCSSLGLEYSENLTQQEVDKAFRDQSRFHSDKVEGTEQKKQADEILSLLSHAKQGIYCHFKWNKEHPKKD